MGLLGTQVVAIVVALVMKYCTRSDSYLEFEEQAEFEHKQAEAQAKLEKLKSKVLAAEQQQPEKRVVHLTAASGSAAQRLAAQPSRSLFATSSEEDAKIDEAELGMIGAR